MNADFQRIYTGATEDEKVLLDERAATLEYDAGHSRYDAEAMAAREAMANARQQPGLFGEGA